MSNKENLEPDDNDIIFWRESKNNYDYGSEEGFSSIMDNQDTEDASETDLINDEEEFIEIKEQVYRDKLADLKNQMKQLEERNHPAYVKGERELEEKYADRQFKNTVFYEFGVERILRMYKLEKEEAYNEFHEKQKELKENIITDLEQQKKMYEAEKESMDIISDTVENSVPNRKLRRRGHELSPPPVPEPRRRKTTLNVPQIKFKLTEDEINEDLGKINEAPADWANEEQDDSEEILNENKNSADIRVENGKLYYEKYWYHRGQQIYYEGKDVGSRNSAVISTINSNEVWVKRTSDSEKFQIYISELLKGQIILKRRSA